MGLGSLSVSESTLPRKPGVRDKRRENSPLNACGLDNQWSSYGSGYRPEDQHELFMNRWWQLWRRRTDMLRSLDPLDRYIATSRVASVDRATVFSFVDSGGFSSIAKGLIARRVAVARPDSASGASGILAGGSVSREGLRGAGRAGP